MNRKTSAGVVVSICTLLIGVLCLILKADVISVALTAFGIALVCIGIMLLIDGNQPGGLTTLILGLVIILLGWTLISFTLYLLAIIMIVFGVSELVQILRFRPPFWGAACLSPLLSAASGVLLLLYQAITVNTIFMIIGVMLIVDSAINLFCCLQDNN